MEETDNGIEKLPILSAVVGYGDFQFLKEKLSYEVIVIQQKTNICSKVLIEWLVAACYVKKEHQVLLLICWSES